jgi:hypothetical protein
VDTLQRAGSLSLFFLLFLSMPCFVAAAECDTGLAATNDCFARRITLTGVTPSAAASSLDATTELGEPLHAGAFGGHSLWWTWTAPASGRVVLSCDNGSNAVERMIGVYTDTSITNLSVTASNPLVVVPSWRGNDAPCCFYYRPQTLDFVAVAGTTYQIAVDVPGEVPGDFTVQLVLAKVSIISPAGAALLNAPTNLLVETATTDLEGAVTNVDFLDGANLLGSAGAPPFSLIWSNVPPGPHMLKARAADITGRITESSTVSIGVVPANDRFTNRTMVAGEVVALTSDNRYAATDAGEPLPGGATGRTVWWSWTAPTNGVLHISTTGSDLRYLDPMLTDLVNGPLVAVWTGGALSSLALYASNTYYFTNTSVRRRGWRFNDHMAFPVDAGVAYQISADGLNNSAGILALQLTFVPARPPANDDFSGRIMLTGTNVELDAATDFATREPGEPLHADQPGGASLWWTWTAPLTGSADLITSGTFYQLLGIYTGEDVTNLVPLASGAGSMRFGCITGTTYQIAVDGLNGASGLLHVLLHAMPAPPNDHFTNATVLTGTTVSALGDIFGASREPGEPNHGGLFGGRSVWFSWIPPTNGWFYLEFDGGAVLFPSLYTGANVADLTYGSEKYNPYTFQLNAGEIYHLAVDSMFGMFGWEGYYAFTLRMLPVPGLDTASSGLLPDGTFRLRVTGSAGQDFAIEASTDLLEWTLIGAARMEADSYDFVDMEASWFCQRFYRALPWP